MLGGLEAYAAVKISQIPAGGDNKFQPAHRGEQLPVVEKSHHLKNACLYIGGSGLDRTDDFQKICRSQLDRIQFFRVRSGLKNLAVCKSLVYCTQ